MKLHPVVKNILRPPYRAALWLAARLAHGLAWLLHALLGPTRFLKLVHFVRREMDTTIEVGGLRFDASHEIPLYRALTLFTKEPDTIAWIDDCVSEGDSFYDVGANIGVFTLYAATRKKAAVVAFEPSSENYAILNRNIYMNGLADRVIALNLALHDRTALSMLNLSAFMPGKAGHGFSIAVAGSDYSAFIPDFRQSVIGYRLDDFVHTFDVPFPNHVKIDVDGNDPVVLEGMRGLLDDPRLKSVAIELNPDFREADRQVADLLLAHGFEKLDGERYRNLANIRDGLAHNYFFVRGRHAL
ncbi:MAG: FkbM family methyltransferase [Alphaproteobacteria bacterium]|nr:FkbM family methyltransferase [Alphaproteobacteria bacterium]MBM3950490.1 FkbM family methyltransferase [Rhodospirillales bacterium]